MSATDIPFVLVVLAAIGLFLLSLRLYKGGEQKNKKIADQRRLIDDLRKQIDNKSNYESRYIGYPFIGPVAHFTVDHRHSWYIRTSGETYPRVSEGTLECIEMLDALHRGIQSEDIGLNYLVELIFSAYKVARFEPIRNSSSLSISFTSSTEFADALTAIHAKARHIGAVELVEGVITAYEKYGYQICPMDPVPVA